MQELLEPDLDQVRSKFNLNYEDGAYSCALTTAWLIKECAAKIRVEVGFNIAVYGFIEGTKTVPRRIEAPSNNEKKPWYKIWK
jgi:hypothetical protein